MGAYFGMYGTFAKLGIQIVYLWKLNTKDYLFLGYILKTESFESIFYKYGYIKKKNDEKFAIKHQYEQNYLIQQVQLMKMQI